jgi:hypothetical protein
MPRHVVTLFVRARTDDAARGILEVLGQLVNKKLVGSFFDAPSSGGDEGPRFSGSVITQYGEEPCDVLARLADIGTFDELRVVGLSASSGAGEDSLGVDLGVRRFRQSLGQLLGARLKVSDHRVAVRAFDEPLPASPFFSVDVNSNIVVIPHDRKTDGGVARPITRLDATGGTHMFSLHGATELASLLGLWSAMESSPVDGLEPVVAGTQIPRLRFVQSRTRILVGPPLPLRSVAPAEGDLPVPSMFLPATTSGASVRGLVGRVYPESLVFTADDVPDFATRIRGGLGELFAFLGVMARTLVTLPKLIVKGVRNEFDGAAARVHQDLVGQDSWLQVIGGSALDVSHDDLGSREVEEIIRRIEATADRELVSPLDADHWSAMVNGVLGSVDGDHDRRHIRQEIFGNENVLLVSREHIGVAKGTLGEALSGFLEEPPLPAPDPTELVAEDGQSPSIIPETVSLVSPGVAASPATLVHGIGQRLTSERDQARAHLDKTAERLRDAFATLRKTGIDGVSTAVTATAWFSLLGLLVLVFTCTPLREFLDFFPSRFSRDAAWVGFSAVFIVLALLLLGVGGDRNWQTRALLTGGVVGGFVAVTLVFFDRIRETVVGGSSSPAAAAILAAGTAALMIAAIRKSLTSDSVTKRELGRLYVVGVSLYLSTGFVFQQAIDGSYLDQAGGDRTRILVAGVVIAGSLLLACLVVVAAVQFRERYRLRRTEKAIEWLRSEMEQSVDAWRRLEAARVQWAGTGAALLRLLTYPLGKREQAARSSFDDLTDDEAILKFDVAELRLNQSGAEGLTARLRTFFVEPGWLRRQYELLVRKFRERTAFRSGSQVDDMYGRRPETDPMVFRSDAVLGGRADSDRWSFARQLFDGEFDELLSTVPEDLSFDEVYQTVLDERESYSLGGAQFGEVSAREFLAQVLPIQVAELPSNVVDRAFTAADPLRRMSSRVWWPTEVAGEAPLANDEVTVHDSRRVIAQRFDDAVVLVAIRVDLSEPFHYTECVGAVIEEKAPERPAPRSDDDF